MAALARQDPARGGQERAAQGRCAAAQSLGAIAPRDHRDRKSHRRHRRAAGAHRSAALRRAHAWRAAGRARRSGARRGLHGAALDGDRDGARGGRDLERRAGLSAMPDPGSGPVPAPPPAPVPLAARCLRLAVAALPLAWLLLALWHSAKPLPPGTHVVSQTYRLPDSDVDFSYGAVLHPATTVQGAAAIEHAETLIVVDRSPLTADLVNALLARKRLRPNVVIVVTTDPGNEAFGGTASRVLTSLEQSGIIVVRARLDRLRDSNPLYSGLWRLLLGWWSDPFDEPPGRVTPAAWARMQNFKADRRQLLAADDGSGG